MKPDSTTDWEISLRVSVPSVSLSGNPNNETPLPPQTVVRLKPVNTSEALRRTLSLVISILCPIETNTCINRYWYYLIRAWLILNHQHFCRARPSRDISVSKKYSYFQMVLASFQGSQEPSRGYSSCGWMVISGGSCIYVGGTWMTVLGLSVFFS